MDRFLHTTKVGTGRLHYLICVSLVWIFGVSLKLALLLPLTCLCRGATSGPSRECMLLFLSPNRVKTFLSLGPSLVNTVALTGLLRRVVLPHSRLSLEDALAVCEGGVPLDAVIGLCLLFFGLLFLSHDSDSDLVVMPFTNFPKFIHEEVPRDAIGCLFTPSVDRVSDYEIGWSLGLVYWLAHFLGECRCQTHGSWGEVHPITQWSRVTVCRGVARGCGLDCVPCETVESVLLATVCGLRSLQNCEVHALCAHMQVMLLAERLTFGYFGSFRMLGLGQLLIVWSELTARVELYVITN
nr:hypothetical protein [Tanacetum cinerariifolium]